MRVLAATAGLLFENLLADGRLGDGLTISDLGLANVRFHTEFALHAIDDDFQMQLAHACDNRLAGFLISRNIERRIFLCQATERDSQLVLIGARFWFHRNPNYRSRKFNRFKNNWLVFITDCIAVRYLLHSSDRNDFFAARSFNIFSLVILQSHLLATS